MSRGHERSTASDDDPLPWSQSLGLNLTLTVSFKMFSLHNIVPLCYIIHLLILLPISLMVINNYWRSGHGWRLGLVWGWDHDTTIFLLPENGCRERETTGIVGDQARENKQLTYRKPVC